MDEAERRRLAALIRESAAPLEPLPPPLPPGWAELVSVPPAGTVRAVLFDVYGTLFCSAAGDIGLTAADATAGGALDTLARRYDPRLRGEDLRAFFRRAVAGIHRARKAWRSCSAETVWPEVRVEEIWADFLREQNHWPPGSSLPPDPAASGRELALRYELAVNPVYPMPGAAETIAALRDSGAALGIISNAQFFTPLLFEAFFGAPPEQLGFDPALIVWSFVMGEAKPSPRLFDTAARQLAARGIAPGECVFVGNDMLSDMYGALRAGFQGVLFAGDSRSLRLREGEPLTQGLRPARIIRALGELLPARLTAPV
jgi:putative hydrolase of the HAD superfamily